MKNGPLTDRGLFICSSMCSTCIFLPGNLMELRPGRVRGMIREALKKDSFIPCHKTLDAQQAVCRGFYDLHRRNTLGCRLGAIFGTIEIDPDQEESRS